MKTFSKLIAPLLVATQSHLNSRLTALQAWFLAGLLMVVSCFGLSAPANAQAATLSPKEVVEYALTLEKLEADFYRRAVDAVQSGRLNVPQVAQNAVVSYGQDEAQHVEDLSAVLTSLGGDPSMVMIPENPNYSAILGRDPFANPADLLLAGQYVEDLGVAAYKGQVQNLLAAGDSADTILAGALAIHSVEARHAAGIRYLRETLLGANVKPWIQSPREVIYPEVRPGSAIPFSSEAFDGYATMEEVISLVGPVLRLTEAPMPRQPGAMKPGTPGSRFETPRGRLGVGEHPQCKQNRPVLDYFTNYLYRCVPLRELNT